MRPTARSHAPRGPSPPQRLVAVFQPHRYTRTAQFLQGFAQALSQADALVLADGLSEGVTGPGVLGGDVVAAARSAKPAHAVG